MCTLNLGEIDAVAFDIDGTLYRNKDFYTRVFPHYLTNLRFFRKYNQVRKELRANPQNEDGYKDLFAVQNSMLAKKLSCTDEQAWEQLEREGFITTTPGRGTFVSEFEHHEISDKRNATARELLVRDLSLCREMGLSLDEILKIIKENY